MRSVDAAWAAGLFEGEGTISIYAANSSGGTRIEVRVSMTDEDVVDRLAALMNVGTTYSRSGAKEGHKHLYTWRVGAARDVEIALKVFLPYLGERRTKRAREALLVAKKVAVKKTHCLRGHPLSGSNLYIVKDKGWRRCKECQRTMHREYARKEYSKNPEKFRELKRIAYQKRTLQLTEKGE